MTTNPYQECLDIIKQVKEDPLTVICKHQKIQYSSSLTAYDYMIAMAEDIESTIRDLMERRDEWERNSLKDR